MLRYGLKEDIVSITGSLIAAKNPTNILDEVWERLQVMCFKSIAILKNQLAYIAWKLQKLLF